MSSQQHLPPTRRGSEPERLVAVYLGARTLVLGPRGVSIHRHTRGTLDRGKPLVGVARLRRVGEPGRAPA